VHHQRSNKVFQASFSLKTFAIKENDFELHQSISFYENKRQATPDSYFRQFAFLYNDAKDFSSLVFFIKSLIVFFSLPLMSDAKVGF
jgi:hypothetical protein